MIPDKSEIELLTEAEAGALIRYGTRTMRKWRQAGEIDFILIDGSIRYSIADLARFIAERKTRCVSLKGPAPRSSGTISPSGVVDIAAARAKRVNAKHR